MPSLCNHLVYEHFTGSMFLMVSSPLMPRSMPGRVSLLSPCPAAVCRRYMQPLEEMYDGNAPGPSIAAWLSTEAKAHARYNCSAHCGGKQYCGAAAPYGSIYGTDSIGAY